MRKTPIKHKVRAHLRKNITSNKTHIIRPVHSYLRGQGSTISVKLANPTISLKIPAVQSPIPIPDNVSTTIKEAAKWWSDSFDTYKEEDLNETDRKQMMKDHFSLSDSDTEQAFKLASELQEDESSQEES